MGDPVVTCVPFAGLDPGTLYALLALRARVFVVEQDCAYLDPDGADRDADHLVARDGERVVGTARILWEPLRIGRVAVAPSHRGMGLGRRLMEVALAEVEARAPAARIGLSAQAHLVPFYASLGFVPVGPVHDEDGIPHVEMAR